MSTNLIAGTCTRSSPSVSPRTKRPPVSGPRSHPQLSYASPSHRTSSDDHRTLAAFIDHAYWGLDKLFAALEPRTDDELDREVMAGAMSARHILLHMYRFEVGWLARLNGDDPPPPEEFANVVSLRSAWEPVQRGWRDYVAGLSEEELEAPFTVSFGSESFSPARHQAISQFVQHQGQNRSELAVITSTFGRSPGEFDWWDYLQDRRLTPV